MTYCEECLSVEQGFDEVEEDGDVFLVCRACGSEGSNVFVDEDYGKDR